MITVYTPPVLAAGQTAASHMSSPAAPAKQSGDASPSFEELLRKPDLSEGQAPEQAAERPLPELSDKTDAAPSTELESRPGEQLEVKARTLNEHTKETAEDAGEIGETVLPLAVVPQQSPEMELQTTEPEGQTLEPVNEPLELDTQPLMVNKQTLEVSEQTLELDKEVLEASGHTVVLNLQSPEVKPQEVQMSEQAPQVDTRAPETNAETPPAAGEKPGLKIEVLDLRTKSEVSVKQDATVSNETETGESEPVMINAPEAALGEETTDTNSESDAEQSKQSFEPKTPHIDVAKQALRAETAQTAVQSTTANGSTNEAVITVNLNQSLPEVSTNAATASHAHNAASQAWSSSGASTSAAADLLAQQLQTGLSSDIVQHASMVLRDGGLGLIRLNLKPESLGNVKIRLEMAENKITGHIFVESEEALRAFQQEIKSIEQAFKDSGFAGAGLELSMSRDGAQHGNGNQGWNDEGNQPFFSERLNGALNAAASSYESAQDMFGGPELSFPISSGSRSTISLLA
jgi:flagellar hook-length control protein FliK